MLVRQVERLRLAILTVMVASLPIAADAALAQGYPLGPARPVNAASSVPYPPDTGVCESGTDQVLRLVETVGAQCLKEVQDNKIDYSWLAAHALAQVWVPGAREWAVEEILAKFGKDSTVCVLTGLVEFGGGSPQAQALAKAAIKEIRELSDRKKFYDKATKAWDGFAKYGREYVLKDDKQRQFLTFLDKKAFDRLKGTAKESSFVSALINYRDPVYKAKGLAAEARRSFDACSLTKAAASIDAAEEAHLDWLRQVRSDHSRLKQGLRCLKEEYSRAQGAILDPGSRASERTTKDFIDQRDIAKFNIEQLEKLDADEVAALQEIADLKAEIAQQARTSVEDTLRKPFNAVKAQVEQAFASCDYDKAQAQIAELRRYTQDARCSIEMRSEYMRELELKNELQSRLAKRQSDEQLIARRFADAMSKGGTGDCKVYSEEAGFIDLATKNVCVDKAAVQDKIAKLRDEARKCEAAKAAVKPPEPGNAVLTMKEPVLDDKKYWAGNWDHNVGNSRAEYYSGEYLAASTHTWTAPQASVGPQGFPVTLTVKCETAAKQGGGLFTSTFIEVKGFQLAGADRAPLKESSARIDVTCDRGGAGSKSDKRTVWVLPLPRYDEGAEPWIKIGSGPKVTYPYVAGKPKQ